MLKRGGEDGVASVEMAMVALLLITLVLGIAEASWAFAQQNAVRAVAREGARTAAAGLDFDCADADVAAGATCSVDLEGSECLGTHGTFTVTAPYNDLTGFFGAFNGLTIDSPVEFVVLTDEATEC
ncbi:hypothetical protein BH24ACT7_BH24ACT7_26160 [soil metagenome]